ncbi:PH and SEC7 domain-containing protein 3-like [Corticium candelabrum]|uniref:PH and SEC7 domain-containing protein 3-like n=1 Tax=Corticium candelabrum TaxID=121492 RepID=UPI002E25A8F3|nr:PH and SEC7 domain-containing protein 3-like [Corticium candelabrum]
MSEHADSTAASSSNEGGLQSGPPDADGERDREVRSRDGVGIADVQTDSRVDAESDVPRPVDSSERADGSARRSQPEAMNEGMNGSVVSHASERMTQPETPNVIVEHDTSGKTHCEAEPTDETPAGLARRLYSLDGYQKSQVAAELSKKTHFGYQVAEEYLRYFDFSCDSLDQALRKFVSGFCLTGETFQRERIIEHFSRRFHQCNPKLGIGSKEAVHTLACSLLLLNTDLHDENMIGKRMSFDDFVENLTGMCDSGDFPRDYLKIVYHGIKSEALEWAKSEEKDFLETQTPRRKPGRSPKKSVVSITSEGDDGEQKVTLAGTFVEVELDKNAKVFREGIIRKKCIMESLSKKSGLGKRSWKECHAVLKGFLLYLNKRSAKGSHSDDVSSALPVTHAYATVAMDYTKRSGVLRFTTSDWKVYLFQAQDPADMIAWMQAINLAAALYSSPPLPAPIGSSKHFQRPVLPRHPSQLKPLEQLQLHHEKDQQAVDELIEHRSSKPYGRGAKRKMLDWQEKLSYLEYEARRYRGYVGAMELDGSNRDPITAKSGLDSVGTANSSNTTLSDDEATVTPSRQSMTRHSYERNSYKRAIYKSPSRKAIDTK